MTSDIEALEKGNKELDEMEQQILEQQKEAEEQRQRAKQEDENDLAVETGPIESQPEAKAPETTPPEAKEEAQVPATQDVTESKPKGDDDPMAWANKRGLTSPEKIAASLRSLEKEFHKRNQQGHPGYKDMGQDPSPRPAPPSAPPSWQPRPNYQPPPQNYGPTLGPAPTSSDDVAKNIAKRYGMHPEDAEVLMPMVLDMANAVVRRSLTPYEQRFAMMERESMKQAQLARIMQDPMFSDPEVVREAHKILEDGTIPEGETPNAMIYAFNQAVNNVARRVILQRGGRTSPTSNRPPVTASGGNGSATSIPNSKPMTEQEFNRLSLDDQEHYLKTGKRPR